MSRRIVTDKLSEIWRQPIVVEAKPAASGNLAWDEVSRAKPDGYTWTFVASATMANPRLYANLRWTEKSFVPVGATAWGPSVLAVHPSLPVTTLTEFIDYVRKHPHVLNWANPGSGTSQHLNTAIFLNATKLDMVMVPYGGQPAAILDLIANRVQFKIASIGLVAQHINSIHHEVLVSRQEFFDCLPKLIWHEDEPVSWPSSVPLYFVAELATR